MCFHFWRSLEQSCRLDHDNLTIRDGYQHLVVTFSLDNPGRDLTFYPFIAVYLPDRLVFFVPKVPLGPTANVVIAPPLMDFEHNFVRKATP
jgi:hypothetical protein